jgi:hypothetical protein
MATDGRTDAQIREEISRERQELSVAVDDLRDDARAAAKVAAKVAGALLAAAVTAAAVKQLKD